MGAQLCNALACSHRLRRRSIGIFLGLQNNSSDEDAAGTTSIIAVPSDSLTFAYFSRNVRRAAVLAVSSSRARVSSLV